MTKCGPLSSKTTLVDGIFAHLGLSENKGHGQRTGRRGREGWRDNCMVWRKQIKRRWLMTPIIPTEFWSRMAPKKARSHFSEHSTINFSRRDLQKVLIFNQNTSHNIFCFEFRNRLFTFDSHEHEELYLQAVRRGFLLGVEVASKPIEI